MPDEITSHDRAGDFYAQVIDQLLQYERDRKTSLEQKALAVITSSGVLVTILFGFATIAKTQESPSIPVLARLLLVAALSAFLVAALISLRIHQPVNHVPLGVKNDLQRMVTDEFWNSPQSAARQSVAEFRVGEIDRWRDENGRKARRLQEAITAQSCGVALVALSVGALLLRVE